MAGTDRRRLAEAESLPAGPAIILVDPQLGENVGMAARAMWNCGLVDLRLVRPREGWPNGKAAAAAAGADRVIGAARVFDSTAAAVADLRHVFATTARERDMVKPALTPKDAAVGLRAFTRAGERSGVLFGPERTGLVNDDVALSEAVILAPMNPAFRSLNLAHAVLLVGYEWFQAGLPEERAAPPSRRARPATRAELVGFFDHLERELDACGFLTPPEKRPAMVRNIRNLFLRAGLTEQEVRTLRGIVAGLVRSASGRGPEGEAVGGRAQPFDREEAAGIVRAAAGGNPPAAHRRQRGRAERR